MKEILMSKKNVDGKEIIKKVPENLASTYEKIGWEIVKEKKQIFSKNNTMPEDK